MSEGHNNEERSWLERMRSAYRLVVMNDETFQEVASYKLSRLNVYMMLSALVVLVAALVVALIVFTPLKQYVPGYGDVNLRSKVERLSKKVDAMQSKIDADSLYIANVRRLILADYEVAEEITEDEIEMEDSLLTVEKIEEDEQLRQAVEEDRLIGIAEVEKKKPEVKSASFSNKNKPLEQLYLVTPVKGPVVLGFLPEEKHFGVDIVAPKNTAIKAVMDGVVIASDWTLETGNTIGIQHGNNLTSFYKHNSVLLKKVGSTVKGGEAIAIIGNTGELTDGPHLHFELWQDGKAINPQDYINFE